MSSSSAAAEASSVLVAVRVRPFQRHEDAIGDAHLVQVSGDSTTLHLAGDASTTAGGASCTSSSSSSVVRHAFSFDRVFFSPTSTSPSGGNDQEAVYGYFGPMICRHVLQGYNSCLFAYGQTGSGKTYSMIGNLPPPPPAALAAGSGEPTTTATSPLSALPGVGLIPRLCTELFERMRQERLQEPSVSHRVECSFMEIYCERVRDLLSGGGYGATGGLRVRQHPTRGPYVEGAQLTTVCDASAVMQLLQQGMKDRATAETKMNDQSSRSHAILQLHVTRVEVVRDSAAVVTKTKSSKVSLVDLAGSERILQSGASGERLEEAKNINLSLHSLGRVIQILADRGTAAASCSAGTQGVPIPPYRESVLTWLLSDSLGGNSKTIMLATVAPSASCFSQTLNTLRFACVAKRVVNVATVNEDSHFHRLVSDLREQILRLTVQLDEKDRESGLIAARRAAMEAESTVSQQRGIIEEQEKKLQLLEHQVYDLTKQVSASDGLVEQCARLRLELHRARSDIAEQQEALCLALTAPTPAPACGGQTTAATQLADAELLNTDLQQQVEDVTQQLRVVTARRETAEVARIEAQLRAEKAVADMRAADQIKERVLGDMQRLQEELAAYKRAQDGAKGQPPSIGGLRPPAWRGSGANPAAVPKRSANKPNALQHDENEQSVIVEGLHETLARERGAASLLAAAEQQAQQALEQSRAMSADVVELEQLLLEETETSQRYLLCGFCDAQMAQLFRACAKTQNKLFREVEHNTNRHHMMALVRLQALESDARAQLASDGLSGADVWDLVLEWSKWRCQHRRPATNSHGDPGAVYSSSHLQDEEERQADAIVRQLRQDAQSTKTEMALLQASLRKLGTAKAAAADQIVQLTADNTKLFQMLSEAQTSLEETKEACATLQRALEAEQAARITVGSALEDDLDGLKGTLSELERENRFVHEANSGMTSTYDLVIRKLRDERRTLKADMERILEGHDDHVRRLQAEHREALIVLEEEKEHLEAELDLLKATPPSLAASFAVSFGGRPAAGPPIEPKRSPGPAAVVDEPATEGGHGGSCNGSLRPNRVPLGIIVQSNDGCVLRSNNNSSGPDDRSCVAPTSQ